MSKPRYTAVESQLTISPPNRSAIASASALLPVAVGPTTATAFTGTPHPGEEQPLTSPRALNCTRSLRSERAPRLLSRQARDHVQHERGGEDKKPELLR